MATLNNTREALETLLLARHPLIYINHYDFQTVDSIIASAGKKAWGDAWSPAKNIIEYSPALGQVHFISKNAVHWDIKSGATESSNHVSTLDSLLENFNNDVQRTEPVVLLLKEIHELVNSPKIYSLLQMIAAAFFCSVQTFSDQIGAFFLHGTQGAENRQQILQAVVIQTHNDQGGIEETIQGMTFPQESPAADTGGDPANGFQQQILQIAAGGIIFIQMQ